jgi:hypothetical protein
MQNGVLCTRALGFALLESKNLVLKRLPVIGSLYFTLASIHNSRFPLVRVGESGVVEVGEAKCC